MSCTAFTVRAYLSEKQKDRACTACKQQSNISCYNPQEEDLWEEGLLGGEDPQDGASYLGGKAARRGTCEPAAELAMH